MSVWGDFLGLDFVSAVNCFLVFQLLQIVLLLRYSIPRNTDNVIVFITASPHNLSFSPFLLFSAVYNSFVCASVTFSFDVSGIHAWDTNSLSFCFPIASSLSLFSKISFLSRKKIPFRHPFFTRVKMLFSLFFFIHAIRSRFSDRDCKKKPSFEASFHASTKSLSFVVWFFLSFSSDLVLVEKHCLFFLLLIVFTKYYFYENKKNLVSRTDFALFFVFMFLIRSAFFSCLLLTIEITSW